MSDVQWGPWRDDSHEGIYRNAETEGVYECQYATADDMADLEAYKALAEEAEDYVRLAGAKAVMQELKLRTADWLARIEALRQARR